MGDHSYMVNGLDRACLSSVTAGHPNLNTRVTPSKSSTKSPAFLAKLRFFWVLIAITNRPTDVKHRMCPMPDKKDALAKSTPTAITVAQPFTLADLCKVAQVQVDAMSFSELSTFIENGILCISANLLNIKEARIRLRPALVRIHDMCGGQGKRNDLTGGVTWTAVCSHLSLLGCKRTLDGLIKDAGLDNPSEALPVGTEVKLLPNGDDRPLSHVAEVTKVHEKTNPADDAKVDVSYKTLDETGKEVVKEVKAVRTIEVEKIKSRKLLALVAGTIYLLDVEGGAEYLYEGGEKFSRVCGVPSKAEAKKFADDEKEVGRERRKREAEEKSNAAKAEREAASAKKKADKAAAAIAEAAKVAANKAEAAVTPKPKTRTKRTVTAVELVAKQLGDKFFTFAKNEVEFAVRTAKSSQFDSLAEAEASALKINLKHGFATQAAAV